MRARLVLEMAANIKDKYYANPFVLRSLYRAIMRDIPLNEITEIVEPAAGDGAIIPYIERLSKNYNIPAKYYDKDPDIPGIEEMNFYKTTLKYKEGRLVVTGPPYSGVNWVRFAKKAAEIGDWVAFISPHSFLELKNPIPELETIGEYNLGMQDFSGSKKFGGKHKEIKTVILIMKRIEPVIDPKEKMVDQDFDIKQFTRGDGPKGFQYFISRQGSNTGRIFPTPVNLFSSIGIKVKNKDMKEPLEEFLLRFKKEYDPLFQKYSPTTKKSINISRFKKWLAKELY